MSLADVSPTSLRIFREVAQRGTLTAAAAALGYTQSAVSRQIASLERAAGTPLVRRHPSGVRLTPAGHVVLRRAVAVLDQLEAGSRELSGEPDARVSVRLGWFASAGAGLVPRALLDLRRTHPMITVMGREAGTPALVRALRAGTLDLAVLSSRPPYRAPDTATPTLHLRILAERGLRVAVPADHPLARGEFVDYADLHGQRWIASPSTGDERRMGVWPGLAERPVIAHSVRDWLAKLNLVAAGGGLTTVPPTLASTAPPGVRVMAVRGGPDEQRRIVLARRPGLESEAAVRLADALRSAAVEVGGD